VWCCYFVVVVLDMAILFVGVLMYGGLRVGGRSYLSRDSGGSSGSGMNRDLAKSVPRLRGLPAVARVTHIDGVFSTT
jgi:hypothetical protein